MWWCLLVLGCLHLQATISTAAAQPLTRGWRPLNIAEGDSSLASINNLYRVPKYQMVDAEESDSNPVASLQADNPPDSYPNPNTYTPGTKRAFTLLSRWHPFSTLSRNAPSIREQNRQILNDLDIETRAMMRPVGQPLRWG